MHRGLSISDKMQITDVIQNSEKKTDIIAQVSIPMIFLSMIYKCKNSILEAVVTDQAACRKRAGQ